MLYAIDESLLGRAGNGTLNLYTRHVIKSMWAGHYKACEIVRRLGLTCCPVSKCCVSAVINKKTVEHKPHPGRPRTENTAKKRAVLKKVLRKWKPTSNAELRAYSAKAGAVYSERTLRRAKKQVGFRQQVRGELCRAVPTVAPAPGPAHRLVVPPWVVVLQPARPNATCCNGLDKPQRPLQHDGLVRGVVGTAVIRRWLPRHPRGGDLLAGSFSAGFSAGGCSESTTTGTGGATASTTGSFTSGTPGTSVVLRFFLKESVIDLKSWSVR